ncbi:hypothetical protein D3C86_1716090 [compost metagenome]
MRGIFRACAMPLAKLLPTSREPSNPGACVNAMACKASLEIPAVFNAWSTTGTMCCRWVLDAISGTTPPYCSCTVCVAMILLNTCPSLITEAAVSSQELSIARIIWCCGTSISLQKYGIYSSSSSTTLPLSLS